MASVVMFVNVLRSAAEMCENETVCFILEHAVAQWLRHHAASEKVPGSRPDEVDQFLQFT
jgi:hypothetical protein